MEIIYNGRYETKQVDENYSNILNIGFDHSHSFYDSKRHRKEDEQVGQNYDADLKVQSVYFQNTVYFNETDTSLSFGLRSEESETGARDEVSTGQYQVLLIPGMQLITIRMITLVQIKL